MEASCAGLHLKEVNSHCVARENKGSIKRTLGISTKSYLHTGEIAGYADKVARVGKAARLIKNGSYIGVALGVGATGLEIQKACTLGREDECSRAQFVEIADAKEVEAFPPKHRRILVCLLVLHLTQLSALVLSHFLFPVQ